MEGTRVIVLSWTTPTDNGEAITGYRIEVSEDGETWTDLEADRGSMATGDRHEGLSPGSLRYSRVSAINANGTGTASAPTRLDGGEQKRTLSASTAPAYHNILWSTASVKPAHSCARQQSGDDVIRNGVVAPLRMRAPGFGHRQTRAGCASAEPASRPSAPRSGGGAERRALTAASPRARCGSDDDLPAFTPAHMILRKTPKAVVPEPGTDSVSRTSPLGELDGVLERRLPTFGAPAGFAGGRCRPLPAVRHIFPRRAAGSRQASATTVRAQKKGPR